MWQVCTCVTNGTWIPGTQIGKNPDCPIHGLPKETKLYSTCDICTYKKELAELKMRVQETIMQAETDTDKDGWITAYHFKTGAIHRLLKDVRDTC